MKKLFIGLATAFLLVVPMASFAQEGSGGFPLPQGGGGFTYPQSGGGFPDPQSGGGFPAPQGGGGGQFELKNPLNFESICGFMKGVFNALITIGIPIAVLFIAYAGFKFVMARGNSTALIEARKNAAYVAIGLAVFLGAWFLSQIIAGTIQALGGPSITTCR